MPGMIRSALSRSRRGSESGGESSPVNHLAEWRERLERSFPEDYHLGLQDRSPDEGFNVNRQSVSPARMLTGRQKERDMYDSSPNYSPLPGQGAEEQDEYFARELLRASTKFQAQRSRVSVWKKKKKRQTTNTQSIDGSFA
ncbi:uncharacterized protein [Diadema antillarum]|uniref:uncharacterized protein n=1 Tax=Diadema antillarum TaxID=105358 RepID=UPI003A882BE3